MSHNKGGKFSADWLHEQSKPRQSAFLLPQQESQLVVVFPHVAKLSSISNPATDTPQGALESTLAVRWRFLQQQCREQLGALLQFEALGQTQQLHGSALLLAALVINRFGCLDVCWGGSEWVLPVRRLASLMFQTICTVRTKVLCLHIPVHMRNFWMRKISLRC